VIAHRAALAREMLGSPCGKTILDVGCGDGSISRQFLPDNSVTFLDLSRAMLDAAKCSVPRRWRSNAYFVQGSILAAPLKTAFDVVICLGVLAHISEPAEALLRLAELVKPGGLCLLQFTDAGSLMATFNRQYWRLRGLLFPRHPYPLTRLTPAEVERLAAETGMHEVMRRRHASPLPGSRLIGQALQLKYLRWSSQWLPHHASEVIVLFRKGGCAVRPS
jgi:SAM-dependent methyltransferase